MWDRDQVRSAHRFRTMGREAYIYIEMTISWANEHLGLLNDSLKPRSGGKYH